MPPVERPLGDGCTIFATGESAGELELPLVKAAPKKPPPPTATPPPQVASLLTRLLSTFLGKEPPQAPLGKPINSPSDKQPNPNPSTHKHRPRYHISAPRGWASDPNGPIYYKGRYHLFYQHLPERTEWDWGLNWGHAVSTDLVHWEHAPTPLAPTPGGLDRDGMFSGSCIYDRGVVKVIYTGVQQAGPGCSLPVTSESMITGRQFAECQILAELGDDGVIRKLKMPLIEKPPSAGVDLIGFRDPYVWREGDEWLMLLGSGIRGVGGTALLYRSANLEDWEFCKLLWVGAKAISGQIWECPLLIKSGNWRVFCVSPDVSRNPILYWVGTFDGREFMPCRGQTPQRLDYGNTVFAATTCIDGKGRNLLWAWIKEIRSSEANLAAGYAGCMTLPRVITVRDDGVLLQEPPEEMAQLREERLVHAQDLALTPGEPLHWDVHSNCLEIEVEVERGSAEVVGIDIRESLCPSKEALSDLNATRAQRVLGMEAHEGVLVSYDYKQMWLEVSWWQPGAGHTPDSRGELVSTGGPLLLDGGENLKLRVFVDVSVVEVFANGKAVLTTRMYRDVISTALLATGGAARAAKFTVWRIGQGVP